MGVGTVPMDATVANTPNYYTDFRLYFTLAFFV